MDMRQLFLVSDTDTVVKLFSEILSSLSAPTFCFVLFLIRFLMVVYPLELTEVYQHLQVMLCYLKRCCSITFWAFCFGWLLALSTPPSSLLASHRVAAQVGNLLPPLCHTFSTSMLPRCLATTMQRCQNISYPRWCFPTYLVVRSQM